jgi:hypothetical protein
MDKKTKLWLGVGVVGVGAYLLWKSKKGTTPALTTPPPAKFVGANSFASVGERMVAADGKFASVGERMIAADGKFASVGERMISAEGVGMINSLDVKGGHPGVKDQGVFANKPFTGDVANMVGANGESVFANQDGSGKFFQPRTARYGTNQGVFAPSKKTTVERPMPPKAVKQTAPVNNLVGADGFFAVHDGFGK